MKQLMRFFALGFFTGYLALHAQNFNGSDAFSSDSGNWGADVSGGNVAGADFVVSGDVLNFNAPVLTAFSQNSTVYRSWTLNAGSYTNDWQVQIDFTVNPAAQIGSQMTSLVLLIANNTDNTDYSQLEFRKTYMGSSFFGSILNTSTTLSSGNLAATAPTATVRASYLAATHELALAVNQGAGFTTVTNTVITSWGMTGGDTFGLQLLATNLANGGVTSAIGNGEVYADNFLASPTAPIPEPATYAAAYGALALLVAGLKRRFGQQ